MSKPSVLGTGTKRLTRRKRGTRRGPKRYEVTPAVTQTDLTTPIYGCGTDILKDIMEEEPEEIDIKVTRQEKELVLARGRKKVKELPQLIIARIAYTIITHEELEHQALF